MIQCPMPRTILIADDDPHIRQLLVFALAKALITMGLEPEVMDRTVLPTPAVLEPAE